MRSNIYKNGIIYHTMFWVQIVRDGAIHQRFSFTSQAVGGCVHVATLYNVIDGPSQAITLAKKY